MQPNQNPQGQNSQNSQNKPSLSWSQPTAPKVVTPSTPKGPDSTSNTGTYAGVFIGGLIVGALLGWGVTDLHQGSSEVSMSTGSTTMMDMSSTSASTINLAGSMVGGTSLAVATQPAGYSVAVSGVDVTEPTWVVVYDDNNGAPGNALGAGLFYPTAMGGTTSSNMPLLRATLPNTNYLVGESIDNGTHQFSLKDKQVLDTSGSPLWVTFQTN